MSIDNRLWLLTPLILICLTGCALATNGAERWPTGNVTYPVDEWKQIDKNGVVSAIPVKQITKWHDWNESVDEYKRKTFTKSVNDGSTLTYTFGTKWGPHSDDRLIITKRRGNEQTHREGFVDQTGNVVIEPIYERANPFNGNYAFVRKNDSEPWEVIDKSGSVKCIIPADLELGYMPVAANGCSVEAEKKGNNRFGINNVKGLYDFEKKVFYPLDKSATVGRESEGLWQYSVSSPTRARGFIDAQARIVIPAQFDFSFGFHDGIACVLKGHQWGYVDRTGEWLIKLPGDCSAAQPFSEGLAAVAIGGETKEPGYLQVRRGARWGFINAAGKFVIPPTYYVECARNIPSNTPKFSCGLAHVAIGDELNHKYGFIDQKGVWKVKPQFKNAEDFTDDHARVCIGHIGFNRNEWNDQSHTSRIHLFILFTKQFDLIGMPKSLVFKSFGEPNEVDIDGDVYALNDDFCANAYIGVKIHYDFDRVSRFKFVGFEKESKWMTAIAPDADILNWRFP